MRVFVQRAEECLQVVADMQRHLRIGEDAPHGTQKILATDFRNPAPPGVVNRYRQAGPQDTARLFGKAGSRKVNVP
jgi:hypothetical protein